MTTKWQQCWTQGTIIATTWRYKVTHCYIIILPYLEPNLIPRDLEISGFRKPELPGWLVIQEPLMFHVLVWPDLACNDIFYLLRPGDCYNHIPILKYKYIMNIHKPMDNIYNLIIVWMIWKSVQEYERTNYAPSPPPSPLLTKRCGLHGELDTNGFESDRARPTGSSTEPSNWWKYMWTLCNSNM